MRTLSHQIVNNFQRHATSLLSVFAVFGVAFLFRPIGGIIFGRLADRTGRRFVLTVTLILMGLATAVISILPTYKQIGIYAPLLLIVLRLLQGLSAGGEAPSGVSFVLEHSPERRRAFWVNFIVAWSAVASMIGSIFAFLLTLNLPPSTYSSFGWRIPYIVALPLALIGLYLRLRTEETPDFKRLEETEAVETSPLKGAIQEHWPNIIRGLIFMGVSAFGFYFLVTYLASYLENTIGLTDTSSLLVTSFSLLLFAILLPLGGRLSDYLRTRRWNLILGSVVIAVITIPAFVLIRIGSLSIVFVGITLVVISLAIYGGGSYTYFAEVFPAKYRGAAGGISYNLGFAIFGGAGPFLSTLLIDLTDTSLAPGGFLAVLSVAALFVAVWAPESTIRNEAQAKQYTR